MKVLNNLIKKSNILRPSNIHFIIKNKSGQSMARCSNVANQML